MKVNNSSANIRWSYCAYVIGAIILATLIRFPIQPVIRDASPFALYFPVVVAIAIFFGWRFGLLATALSILPANYYWMPPANAFELNSSDLCHIISFSFVGLSVSWISEAARKRKQLAEHLCATIANIGAAIVTTDCDGRILYLNTVARMLTELHGREGVGCTFGSTLDLFSENGEHSLNGTFQAALRADDIENLPRRVIVSSKSGKRYPVEQKTSRIMDASGETIGMAILFHRLECLDEAMSAPIEVVKDAPGMTLESGRIAMVCTHGYVAAQPRLEDADAGGHVVYILELSKKLAQLGYAVDIWTRQFEDQPECEVVSPQVRIVRVPCGGRDFIPKEFLCEHLPEWNKNALRFIEEHGLKYELINSHYWDGGLAADHLSRALGVRHIHTPHSLGIWKRRQMEAVGAGDAAGARLDEQYNFTKRIASEMSLYVSADVIVATSPEQQGILMYDYKVPTQKCRVIPPGYDDTRFFPVSDSARGVIRNRLGFNTPVVQAIGRLADNRGYELLVKAFAVVAERMPNALLHLAVGGKALTPQETAIFVRLRTLVSEMDLTRKVIFTGFIPDDQLADYYRAADVSVISSRSGPIGMMVVEAMACGTPTVLSIHGGLCHSITFEGHGLCADPCDPEELGTMILTALKDVRLRLESSRAGAEKAQRSLTWNGVAQQLLALAPERISR